MSVFLLSVSRILIRLAMLSLWAGRPADVLMVRGSFVRHILDGRTDPFWRYEVFTATGDQYQQYSFRQPTLIYGERR